MTLYLYVSIFFTIFCFYLICSYKPSYKSRDIIEYLIIILLILISTFRWKVGGDWISYYDVYQRSDLKQLTFEWSFVYELLNYLSKKMMLGVWGVNFFVSSIFFFALYRISKQLKFDLIFIILISFSIIYFNILMGYVRQGLCLSLLILAISYLIENKINKSLLFLALATLTHLSVIIFIPYWIYIFKKNKILISIFILSLVVVVFFNSGFLLVTLREFLIKSYLISAGFIFRSIPLILSVLVFLIFYRKIYYERSSLNDLLMYSTLIIVLLNIMILLSSTFSAVLDRINVYFTFYQLIVIGKFSLYIKKKFNNLYIQATSFIIIFYFILLLTWFLYGDYSVYWLNYNFLFG